MQWDYVSFCVYTNNVFLLIMLFLHIHELLENQSVHIVHFIIWQSLLSKANKEQDKTIEH